MSAFVAMCLGLLCAAAPRQSPSTATVSIEGSVADDRGAALAMATVRVFDLGGAEATGTTDGAGAFALKLAASRPSITCDVSAPGYRKGRHNLIVRQGVANAGRIQLKPAVEVGTPRVSEGGQKTIIVEVVVSNHADAALALAGIELGGDLPRKVMCANPDYALRFTVEPDFQVTSRKDNELVGKLEIKPGMDDRPLLPRKGTGLVLYGKCGGSFTFRWNYAFTLEPRASQVVQIVLPQETRMAPPDSPAAPVTLKLAACPECSMHLRLKFSNDQGIPYTAPGTLWSTSLETQ